MLKTRHPKIFIGKIATYSNEQVDNILDELRLAVTANNEMQIRRIFNQTLPEANLQSTETAAITTDESTNGGQLLSRPATLGLAEK